MRKPSAAGVLWIVALTIPMILFLRVVLRRFSPLTGEKCLQHAEVGLQSGRWRRSA
jgi:hypothetical protein